MKIPYSIQISEGKDQWFITKGGKIIDVCYSQEAADELLSYYKEK